MDRSRQPNSDAPDDLDGSFDPNGPDDVGSIEDPERHTDPDSPDQLDPVDAEAVRAPAWAGDPSLVVEQRSVATELIDVDDTEHPGHHLANTMSWIVVGLTCLFVFVSVSPWGVLSTSTPTGGDMGAHVWGPAFLRDHLLPHFRLTGWTPDWYAGFPAYVFYMVIPSLLIVIINVGPPLWLSPFLLAAIGFAAWQVPKRITNHLARVALWVPLALLAMLSVPVPYEVAFKIVTVSGVVTLPLAAFALARSFKMPFPGPALVAVAAAGFLYETGYTILGGNITSTMAGEFAFSVSLTLCVLYLAVLVKGVRTGRQMALAATLFGLVILCHIIPAMFAAVATVIFLLTRREDRVPWWDSFPVARGMAAGLVVVAGLALLFRQDAFPLVVTAVVVLLFVGIDLRAFTFSSLTLPVGGLLACFWFVPFFLDSPFMDDMGWEKYTRYADYLWPQTEQFNMPYRNVVFALAVLGVLLSLVHRQRIGWYLTLIVVSMAWAFRFAPQWRLWNARILPFYFLALYLLAGIAVALIIRSVSLVVADLARRRDEPVLVGVVAMVVVAVLVGFLYAGALRILPGGSVQTDAAGVTAYKWMGLTWHEQNVSASWAKYNYEGLEGRDAYPEFRELIDSMAKIGTTNGCGRAMWEYEPNLGRFGTPMALMLLPYFTDGCIGSMEGLYFEASSTTPFHFLNQSELSAQPSRAQRDMPYSALNMDLGISHLQMLGVKYYMATSDQAIAAAREEPRLKELKSITPPAAADGVAHEWVVFEVADSELVSSLTCQPVVLTNTDDHIDGWVYAKERAQPALGQEVGAKLPGPAVKWYQDPTRWNVPLATSGPPEWKRVSPDSTDPPCAEVPEVKVSNIESGDDTISFDVSDVGTPVVVKSSFFPNWEVSGAKGPYRVSPNLMVVVPTEKTVTLHYGTTNVDRLGWLLTVFGILGVVGLAVWDDRSRSSNIIARVGALRPFAAMSWASGPRRGEPSDALLFADAEPESDTDAEHHDDEGASELGGARDLDAVPAGDLDAAHAGDLDGGSVGDASPTASSDVGDETPPTSE